MPFCSAATHHDFVKPTQPVHPLRPARCSLSGPVLVLKPLCVVENSYGGVDEPRQTDGTINASVWIAYGRKHIREMAQAIEDGCDIMGYTWWGPIDIVSTGTGEMKKRYGFIYIDKGNDGNGTLKRSKKRSVDGYKQAIARNGETL